MVLKTCKKQIVGLTRPRRCYVAGQFERACRTRTRASAHKEIPQPNFAAHNVFSRRSLVLGTSLGVLGSVLPRASKAALVRFPADHLANRYYLVSVQLVLVACDASCSVPTPCLVGWTEPGLVAHTPRVR